MSFTDLDTVMLFLTKDSLNPKEELQVGMLITQIDGLIENYCGWDMLAKSYTNVKFNGTGEAQLDLKVYPINSLTKVEVSDGSTTYDVTSTVESIADSGILYFPSGATSDITNFIAGTQNITLSFNAGFGYNGAAIPNALQMAATELVVIYFNRIVLENIGVKRERFEQDEVEYDKTDIPSGVARRLDRYRRFIIV